MEKLTDFEKEVFMIVRPHDWQGDVTKEQVLTELCEIEHAASKWRDLTDVIDEVFDMLKEKLRRPIQ